MCQNPGQWFIKLSIYNSGKSLCQQTFVAVWNYGVHVVSEGAAFVTS